MALLHHVTVEALHDAFHSLRKDAAAGVDGVTWEMYADGLEGRLAALCARVHRGAYRAPAWVFIPKEDGGQRPLGIAALEDKVFQRAVTDVILVPIYETEFLGFSYGFRPGRGTHNALDAVTVFKPSGPSPLKRSTQSRMICKPNTRAPHPNDCRRSSQAPEDGGSAPLRFATPRRPAASKSPRNRSAAPMTTLQSKTLNLNQKSGHQESPLIRVKGRRLWYYPVRTNNLGDSRMIDEAFSKPSRAHQSSPFRTRLDV